MSTIPLEVSHEDLIEAIRPLCTLLGTSPEAISTLIPVVIEMNDDHDAVFGHITFAVAAGEDLAPGRPGWIPATADPQGREHTELAHMIQVTVLEGQIVASGSADE